VLQYLAFAATAGSSGAENVGLEARILASNPILEAFGNAKTSMNNNSSRYGKFLMLQFNASGRLVGARVNTYLLEKTRVVAPGPGERNHHPSALLRPCCTPLRLLHTITPAAPPYQASATTTSRTCYAARVASRTG